MAERERQSGVWQYFEIISERPHIAKCLDCGKEVPRGKDDTPKKSLGLTGLWDHLRIQHKESFKEAEKVKEDQVRKKQKKMKKS